jgi:hypothetical protein
MNATETRTVIDHYFDLMGRGEDFAPCYAEDVRWTMFDGGTEVVGPTTVREYLIGVAPQHARHTNPAAHVCGRDCLC